MTAKITTVDETGRVFIPQDIIQKLGLTSTTQLSLEIVEGKLVLQPLAQNPRVINENGLLVVDAPLVDNIDTIIDDIRSERIDELSSW